MVRASARSSAPDLEARVELGSVTGHVSGGGDPSRNRIASVTHDGGHVTFRLQGEIVYSNEAKFVEEILRGAEGFDRVTLDLSGVEYVDSAGIALFVRLTRAITARGGKLTVTQATSFVDSIFSMVSLRSVVDIR